VKGGEGHAAGTRPPPATPSPATGPRPPRTANAPGCPGSAAAGRWSSFLPSPMPHEEGALGGGLVSKSIDLSPQLPGVSFIEGSTIDATVRATAERDVTVEGGRVELVRTMTYRYTAWSPYASPITIPARGAKVISQAHFHPAGPLLGGRPLLQPVALDIPPTGPARSRPSWSTSAGRCRPACTSPTPETSRRPRPSWCSPRHATAPPWPTHPRFWKLRGVPSSASNRCRAAGWPPASPCPAS
jgi:hypothetical protein